MRPLESTLLFLTLIAAVGVLSNARPGPGRLKAATAGSLVVLILYHLIENVRIQMIPAVGVLALSLLVLWRRSRSASLEIEAERQGFAARLTSGTFRMVVTPLALVIGLVLPAVTPVPRLPTPSGPHQVGVSDFAVTFLDRPEILTLREDDVREVPVRAWYPTDDDSGLRPERYMSREEMDAFMAGMGGVTPTGKLLYPHLRLAKTRSYPDAPLASGSGLFPVLAFSHGYSSFQAQNTALMEELASHGYVVFSLGHTYDGAMVFPDGRATTLGEHVTRWYETQLGDQEALLADMSNLVESPDQATRMAALRKMQDQAKNEKDANVGVALSWDIWLQDRFGFFDVMEDLQSGVRPSRFQGRLDLDRIGLLGMSFGGATAAEVCHLDSRCQAAINLDGGHMYGLGSELFDGPIARPLLMLYSSDLTTKEAPSPNNPGDFRAYNDFFYEPIETAGTRDDVVRIRIAGTSHLHISDLSLGLRWIPVVASRTPGAKIAEILNRYSVAFFNEHLFGEPSPLLDGPVPEFPEVTFQTFGR